MKILSIYYTHKPGGFCKRLYRLLGALASQGHAVLYISLDPPPPTLSSAVSFCKIPFPFKHRSGLIFWLVFILWAPIFTCLKALSFKPERIVVFNPIYAAITLPAKLTTKSALLLFMRSLPHHINRLTKTASSILFVSDSLERLGVRGADKAVCMTHSMAEEVRRFASISRQRIVVLPNNIDSCSFENESLRSANSISILFSGVLDQRKNVALLLRALALLPTDLEDAYTLTLAGDGPLRSELESIVRALGLKNVHFAGWVESIHDLLGKTDIVIHPSLHEGMSNSVLEALAAGKIVLSAKTPEALETLGADELLFNSEDPSDLATHLAVLLRSESARRRARELCHEQAKKLVFDWDYEATRLVIETTRSLSQ